MRRNKRWHPAAADPSHPKEFDWFSWLPQLVLTYIPKTENMVQLVLAVVSPAAPVALSLTAAFPAAQCARIENLSNASKGQDPPQERCPVRGLGSKEGVLKTGHTSGRLGEAIFGVNTLPGIG